VTVQPVVAHALIRLGALLIGVAALGLVRLPDVFTRANAVAKAASLGVVCILLGVVVLGPGPTAVVTLLVAVVAQLFPVPVAGYAIGRAAHRSGAPATPRTRWVDRPRRRVGTGTTILRRTGRDAEPAGPDARVPAHRSSWNDSGGRPVARDVTTLRRALRLLDDWTLSAFNPRPFNPRRPGGPTGQ